MKSLNALANWKPSERKGADFSCALSGDISVPFEEGRIIAAGIPNSRLVALESRSHLLLDTDPAWHTFLSEVRRFLAQEELVSPLARRHGGSVDWEWLDGSKGLKVRS
jgi:hypothetical protein